MTVPGPRVVFADLGDWGPVRLVAEYDAAAGVIRIDRAAVARVRAALGDNAAERFVACAIAHERRHAERPDASEAAARAAGAAAAGVAPDAFDAVLRG